MKKTKISLMAISAVLTLIAVFATSCEKEELVPTDLQKKSPTEKTVSFKSFNLKLKNNMLSVSSVDEYESMLNYLAEDEKNNFENWNTKINFNSLKRAYKNNKSEMPVNDNIAANFLNYDGCIEINNKIFKLNFDKRLVYVYENFTHYLNNKFSKTYSFDDEVLTIEFGTEAEITQLTNDCIGAPLYFPRNRIWYNVGTTNVKYCVRYVKLGVYFTLFSSIWKTKIQWGGTYVSTWNRGSYTPRNRPSKNFDCSDNGWGPNSYTARSYSSIRRLSSYDIEAGFHSYATNDSRWDSWSHSY